MRRYRQYIFVLRETVSSYTIASIIESESQDHLRDAILILCSELKSLRTSGVTIRVDPAPGLSSLVNDKTLTSYGIHLEVGRSKNPNKNPVAERAIAVLGVELLKLHPEGCPVTPVLLAHAVANMNSRIRRDRLSAREIWTQRDQMTGEPLPIVDRDIILRQNAARKKNHLPSAKSKASGKPFPSTSPITTGDLVFLKGDKDKTKVREKYLVIAMDNGKMCHLRKFTSSQFRSKVYVVPITDCYPIQSTTSAPLYPPQRPTHGHREVIDSDSDESFAVDAPPDQSDSTISPDISLSPVPSTQLPPPVPDAISTTPVLPCTPAMTSCKPSSPSDVARRSSRARKAPFWCTEDWDLD